jgi:hypothetical protein
MCTRVERGERDDGESSGDGVGSCHGRVTYNGHLLHYFSGDAAAGDMNGKVIE